jgi:hypothetical protein
MTSLRRPYRPAASFAAFSVAAAVGLVALPAAPAAALDPWHHTCGLTTVNDLTGLYGGPANFNGTLVAGPWKDETATSVEITCRVFRNGVLAAIAYPGTTGTPATYSFVQVAIAILPADVVEVCTEVVTTGGPNAGTFSYDADPVTPGVQCPQAPPMTAGPLAFRIVPQAAV